MITNKFRSEAILPAFVMGNKGGEKVRNVESEGDEEGDQGQNQGGSSSDVADRNKPFNT